MQIKKTVKKLLISLICTGLIMPSHMCQVEAAGEVIEDYTVSYADKVIEKKMTICIESDGAGSFEVRRKEAGSEEEEIAEGVTDETNTAVIEFADELTLAGGEETYQYYSDYGDMTSEDIERSFTEEGIWPSLSNIESQQEVLESQYYKGKESAALKEYEVEITCKETGTSRSTTLTSGQSLTVSWEGLGTTIPDYSYEEIVKEIPARSVTSNYAFSVQGESSYEGDMYLKIQGMSQEMTYIGDGEYFYNYALTEVIPAKTEVFKYYTKADTLGQEEWDRPKHIVSSLETIENNWEDICEDYYDSYLQGISYEYEITGTGDYANVIDTITGTVVMGMEEDSKRIDIDIDLSIKNPDYTTTTISREIPSKVVESEATLRVPIALEDGTEAEAGSITLTANVTDSTGKNTAYTLKMLEAGVASANISTGYVIPASTVSLTYYNHSETIPESKWQEISNTLPANTYASMEDLENHWEGVKDSYYAGYEKQKYTLKVTADEGCDYVDVNGSEISGYFQEGVTGKLNLKSTITVAQASDEEFKMLSVTRYSPSTVSQRVYMGINTVNASAGGNLGGVKLKVWYTDPNYSSDKWVYVGEYSMTTAQREFNIPLSIKIAAKTFTYYYPSRTPITASEKEELAAYKTKYGSTYVKSTLDEATTAAETRRDNYVNEQKVAAGKKTIKYKFQATTIPTGYYCTHASNTYTSSGYALTKNVSLKMNFKEVAAKSAKLSTSKVTCNFTSTATITTTNRKTGKAVKGVVYNVWSKDGTASTWSSHGTRTTDKNGNITLTKKKTVNFQLSANNYNYYTNYTTLRGNELAKANKNIKTGKWFKTKSAAQTQYNKDVSARKTAEANKLWNIRLKIKSVPKGYVADTNYKTYNIKLGTSKTSRKATVAPK